MWFACEVAAKVASPVVSVAPAVGAKNSNFILFDPISMWHRSCATFFAHEIFDLCEYVL